VRRFWFVDTLKFLGAQCILLHHLSIYGPIAQEIGFEYPIALDDFTEITRLAVQVFLVISGYLTAQALSQMREVDLMGLLVKRYARLAPFYLLSLGFCVLVSIFLEDYLWGSWVPEVPSVLGFLAHAFLLEGLLDVPSISSGVWYVAIDFQLFGLTMIMASLLSKRAHGCVDSTKLKRVLALLGLISLWVFNLHEALDNWAIYFFGAYALGLFARWAQDGVANRNLFWCVWLLGGLSVIYEPRIRIFTALVASLALFLWAQNRGDFLSDRFKSKLALLGDSAYAVFLNHFVLIMVFSAVWNAFEWQGLQSAFLMTLAYWACALMWGIYLHTLVESQLQRLHASCMALYKRRAQPRSATELYKAI